MAGYQRPYRPELARELDPRIVQIHSADYRNPSQLREGSVLVVGAGNSGAEIAKELAGEREVWMAGRDVGAIPFRISGFWGRTFLVRLVLRFLFHRILTIRTPVGRKVRPTILAQGGPLTHTRGPELETMGVKRVPKVRRAVDGKPQLEDGRILDATNVVWCTGFRTGFPDWIDLPIFGAKGYPAHEAGVVAGAPGLHFVGLHFLYSLSSAMVHGVGRDAERIARAVSRRACATTRSRQRERGRAAS